MAQIRDLFKHVLVEKASRKRKCARKPGEHSVMTGELCLVVKSGPHNSPKSYCSKCAKDMLNKAKDKLTQAHSDLGI